MDRASDGMRHPSKDRLRRLLAALAGMLLLHPALPVAVAAATHLPMPRFIADTNWLQMPNGWLIGEVSAVAVDAHDNVWVLHRPRTVAVADRARAAPPVLAFDRDGHFLRGFGGPGAGYEWPATEHSIAVDKAGRVWIAGNARTPPDGDDMLLVFSTEGKFLRQTGRRNESRGDSDTVNVHAPADLFVDDAAHEVYVADGYLNRRIIVFDTETGAFKRMWSAFGKPPPLEPATPLRDVGAPFVPVTGAGPPGFNGVHGVEISRDGKVYVSDRNNQRIQVFTKAGGYLQQGFVDRNMPSPQSASGLAFSPDARQRYLYVADWGNSQMLVLDRATLTTVGRIGGKGSGPGEFIGPHLIATDSRGVLYVAEVQGRRLQRLVPTR
jgi:DNA-binding beta-propeller fold protein YncE